MTPRRFAFTKKAIESLPAHDADSPSREAEYSDSECIGLKLRVSKNGRRFFQFRYTSLSRKKCLKIGEFPHVSLQEARLKVNEWKSLLARDIDPSDERHQRRDEPTFSEFAERFYIPFAQSHKITWQDDVYKIRGHINRAIGNLRLSSITARDLTSFQSKMKNLNSATSANAQMRLIRRMLNLAINGSVKGRSSSHPNSTSSLSIHPLACPPERYHPECPMTKGTPGKMTKSN